MSKNQEYNDLKQVEMAILSAEHMVGQATRTMDEGQLNAATNAISDAKKQLRHAISHQTGLDDSFLEVAEEFITKADHQLSEAKKHRDKDE
ncbi:DUF2564 family protein [Bacillus sp. JCM 19034]|uniref:DUF2564 family protein n=1 Tax=Bacillus sp. JCM 19034 TaxID=1481928 RepID=UPI000785BCEA|nr:DUF2564 family protein [Bacillus sp. JCM 19034]